MEGSESEADFIDGMAPPKLPPPASSRRSVYRWDKDDRDDRMSQVSIKVNKDSLQNNFKHLLQFFVLV